MKTQEDITDHREVVMFSFFFSYLDSPCNQKQPTHYWPIIGGSH